MRWRKLGLLYHPDTGHPKLISHAANPVAVPREGNVYRVFFSGRDAMNRSSVGFVDVDIVKCRILYAHDKPVFDHGPEGSFYASGVSLGNCYQSDGQRFLSFMGWQRPAGSHWKGHVGRLRLEADFSIRPEGAEAFTFDDDANQLSLSYPWVSPEKDGRCRMWYGSTVTWDGGNGEMVHLIEQASSNDGSHWRREGTALPWRAGLAQAFSRPSVIGNGRDGYRMWFSYRGGPEQTYRIGYAASANGNDWELRLDEAGIDVSESGWDSEMIEYPFVFSHNGDLFMLYNGNRYGSTGFGLATLTE